MNEWTHSIFLSDGTTLSQSEWDILCALGEIKLDNGRTVKYDREKAERERAWSTDMKSLWVER